MANPAKPRKSGPRWLWVIWGLGLWWLYAAGLIAFVWSTHPGLWVALAYGIGVAWASLGVSAMIYRLVKP